MRIITAILRNTKKVEIESKIRDTRPDEFTQHSRRVGCLAVVGISFRGGWGTDDGRKASSANGSCQRKRITWPEGQLVSPGSRGI